MTSAGVSLLLLCFLISLSVTLSTQSSAPKTDEFLGPAECLDRKLTRESCDLVFCPPWQYCVDGRCSCKPAIRCPTENMTSVCGHNNRLARSYCQAMAISCQTKRTFMSHFDSTCTDHQPKFRSSVEPGTGLLRLFIPRAGSTGSTGSTGGGGEEVLVCEKLWDMAAANVACRQDGHPLGAASIGTTPYSFLMTYHNNRQLPSKCVSVRCQGYENSLAECEIYDKTPNNNRNVATATCIQPPDGDCEFRCVNSKCVSLSQTCDGVDDCGDRSDEMCCKKCRNGAFRCSSGVCLHKEAVRDGQIDCLDGEDESKRHTGPQTPFPGLTNAEYVSPRRETRVTRANLESRLSCGIPNLSGEDDDFVVERGRSIRIKRVVGGWPAKPAQIQWQAAIYKDNRFQCGGAYISGCWVITAAHCLGNIPSLSITQDGDSGRVVQKSDPKTLIVKLSVWRMNRPQLSTEVAPVQDVHIHPRYNPNTHENDIALVQLQKLPFMDQCVSENPAITPVCVPWTTRLFNPNHTCTISGWGSGLGSRLSQVLEWANVSLIENCQRFHNDSVKPGMICAGELDGSVDACEGDNGGPLVCKDELGVSYLWGIISWGRGCGRPGFPGVYTQVAHYFEWIRQHTGWPAVTKYNS